MPKIVCKEGNEINFREASPSWMVVLIQQVLLGSRFGITRTGQLLRAKPSLALLRCLFAFPCRLKLALLQSLYNFDDNIKCVGLSMAQNRMVPNEERILQSND